MEHVALQAHEQGVVLPVQAQPRARKNGIAGCHDGALKVQVTQAPEKGKANSALAKVLARELRLRKSQVELLSGPASPRKTFLITGISVQELREQIAAALKSRSPARKCVEPDNDSAGD